MAIQIQMRRGTESAWTSANPTLAAGEIGFETDTNLFKIGTGSTAWTSLPYAGGSSGYTTTATAAGTTTLTSSSNPNQFFTGTTTQTVVLPVTSTLTLGKQYFIFNNSTGVVTVQSSGANTILAMPSNTAALYTCILTSGTTASSWAAFYDGFTSVTGTGGAVLATAPTITNVVLSGTLNAGGGNGTSGQVLQSTGTGIQWATAAAGAAFSEFMLIGA